MDTGAFLTGICFFLLSLNGFVSLSPTTSFCPDRCDCQPPQHLMCTNRGWRTVPKPKAAMQGPEEVQIFSLGGNFITNISAFDFTRYSDLIRLNLQYNQIQTIHPKAFEKLSKLEELYLGHNLLSNVPAGTLQPLKKLTILYGNNNNIKKITPELFFNLDNLVKLRLDVNSIEVLQDSVFKSLSRLHYLHLESNKLQYIHKNAFSKLTSLRFLNLAHNKQSAVRNVLTFSQLTTLTTLLLSDNEIQYIGNHVFQNLKKLSKLSLSNNRISRLDNGALRGLSSLRELLINGNALEEIPAGLLDPLERIEELDFSNNRISNVDSLAFSQLKHLKVLRLKNNFLTSLSGDIFALNSVLYDLDLHGNNWTCDCRLKELKRWMTVAHSQGKLLTVFVQCHYPTTLRGKYLDYVNSSQLQPLGNWSHLCRSQTGPEESRGGGVLLKVEGKDVIKQELKGGEGQVEDTKGVDLRQGNMEEATVQKEVDKWKREGQERMGVQGDQGGPELSEPSSSLTQKKPKESLSPRSRTATEVAGKRAKGRRRSNVISRTDPPVINTPSYRNSTNSSTELPTASPEQPGGKFDLLRSDGEETLPVITDPCVFNRHFITNVSVDQVTSSTVTVHWTTREHHRYTPGPGPSLDEVHYRILFDRFGAADRFPRYVYAHGTARSVTLRELSSDLTYIVCVEGVVGGSVCQVAPRDHCAGLVTLPEASSHVGTLTSDLQLLTVAMLAGNAVLLLIIGGVWLGRSLKRRLQRRKSAVHVRHMYSTRRPFRPTVATASVSTDFTSYQSSRPARLAPLEEGDLIEFPCDRFLDSSARRDSDMQRFSD
ncbi:TLR4 interactor with leucine rich repeats [Echeneis naucrates]|uniref:Fibronectin type-III domain-containing protein n=1 Tax=Echeneis naucrates TaxID=173247 RepID=A0A665WJ67_ECHNA|nr:TLR4 interactor with leucine rich repeats [Echeneis naucrates]XP_029370442.1 TLR4 interactor with leucine rich repeats [Echeneis naucrates]XP_029370443.1 TLR4 interactor with leucine rich repeats [Echeneis naucrates]XP_029370444.1 TLR4 interactor with leucine rich repeats [Echeneis naucrates]XP_029370445.1 TLR4 interactor with leucine rich repeats [Echeneis naucrates]